MNLRNSRPQRSGNMGRSRTPRFILVGAFAAAAALAGAPLVAAAHSLISKPVASTSGAPSAPCPGSPGICPQ
jgi:hypothetical protein